MMLTSTRQTWSLRKRFHPRRTHKKSRSGCQPCKVARLKCDETKPICRRCSFRAHKCHYVPQGLLGLAPGPAGYEQCLQPIALAKVHAELWYHFTTSTWATLADASVVAVIRHSLSLAFCHDDLKHAILALAATHRRFLQVHDRHECLVEQHVCQAVALFRSRLLCPPTASTMDTVLLTSFLLTTQNFFLSPRDFAGSWGQASNQNLRWLTLMSGWRTVLLQHRTWLSTSAWAETLPRPPLNERITLDPSTTLDHKLALEIPIEWRVTFDIHSGEDLNRKPYGRAVYDLARLMAKKDFERPLTQIMTFAYRLDTKMWQLLRARNSVALCVLAMWLGCLCQVDTWWTARRAQQECFAVCELLNTVASPAQKHLLKTTVRSGGFVFD
jgi:hypothetical protein